MVEIEANIEEDSRKLNWLEVIVHSYIGELDEDDIVEYERLLETEIPLQVQGQHITVLVSKNNVEPEPRGGEDEWEINAIIGYTRSRVGTPYRSLEHSVEVIKEISNEMFEDNSNVEIIHHCGRPSQVPG